MQLYKKVEQFVVDAFTKAEKSTDVFHAQRTAYWITQLKPDADEALQIAGFAHDIERAFYGDWKKGSSDADALRKHQDMSAAEITKFLRAEHASEELIDRVSYLVAHHEEGGDVDQTVLCDADCLAYFEEKAVRNAKEKKQQGKNAEMIKKIDYVFSRIASSKAREIARPFYDEAMHILRD
ncbi:MAG: hypothetical protein ACD_81C00217G0009 [uncultured bacterium]|uniref:HD domain-containing protein n=2 Tax=Candidatus Wolfeibacteriota TaxID=1752735 RepID=A0A0G1HAE6_9BACT|nr:MAG: hypothetical protein ACD_81C00217G0009 [uncultured bacterium]KKR12799.1 MAG: hypothetical protein UT41_C0001G0343 [Candidatus Wolfebacteria bacterium GW2011_GWC2_39_22]KKT43730.1 MAG: hypothetical protein UW32_C0001G0322 [Candidatus Wolfebacteria bacterium GW2011_GWE2_44_13]